MKQINSFYKCNANYFLLENILMFLVEVMQTEGQLS